MTIEAAVFFACFLSHDRMPKAEFPPLDAPCSDMRYIGPYLSTVLEEEGISDFGVEVYKILKMGCDDNHKCQGGRYERA